MKLNCNTIKKALVMGSEGNIGSPLVNYLRQLGYQVLETDVKPAWKDSYYLADINHPIDMLSLFDWKPDYVFLLSAMVSRVTCEQASSLAITTNLSGINNVIQLCKRINAKLIYFSTSEVYGPNCQIMSEDLLNPEPNNRYGLSKLLGEKIVEYEVKYNNLNAVTLRPFMMYDENEDFGDHRSAMIRFAFNLFNNKEIEVHNNSSRGWLHVSDAINAIESATRVSNYNIINIGHPESYSIKYMAECIAKYLNADFKLIKFCDIPNQMTLNKNPTLLKQKNLLNFTPSISLQEGIVKVCEKLKQRNFNI